MKQLLIFLTLSLFFTFHLTAQEMSSKWDFRLGVGRSLLGSGDIRTNMIENELNYKFNHYLAASISLAYAKGGSISDLSYGMSYFWQSNLTSYISPFQNESKHDFRVGLGLSYYQVAEIMSIFIPIPNEPDGQSVSFLDRRTVFGGNFVIEYALAVHKNWLIGIKAVAQPYVNGDTNSGILLKIGRKL